MTTFTLKESLVISNMSAIKTKIDEILATTNDEIHLDFSQIEDCDSSGAQLLISLHKHAIAKQKIITFSNDSQALNNAFALVGISNVSAFFSTSL